MTGADSRSVSVNIEAERDALGWVQQIYNRPARVDAVYTDTVKVWWQDNNTLGYVSIEQLGDVRE